MQFLGLCSKRLDKLVHWNPRIADFVAEVGDDGLGGWRELL
jgi:hypothetical protein